MKQITFVIFTDDFSWGTAILASLAEEQGWDADVLFLPRNNATVRFSAYLEEYAPDVVGTSFMSYDRRLAFSVAEICKEKGVPVIAGGVHPTFLPTDVAAADLFNAIVTGDGMGVLEDILADIGAIKKASNLVIKGKRHQDRSLYTKLFFSASQIDRMRRTKSCMLLSSQGCPFRCRFCASGALEYIAYSPEEIVRLMECIYENYDVTNFQFFDDLFAKSLKRCRSIHNAVIEHFGKENQIKYGNFVQARASSFDDQLAEELVRMGVTCVNFGIETASPSLLKFLNKRQTLENCYDAMRICKRYKLIRKVNLMFGVPTQTREDYEMTLDFIKETDPEIKSCFFYVPMPGSDLYSYCFENGYLPSHCDPSRFDWFQDRPDGFADIQCRLLNVDYDMAVFYRDRIERTGAQIDSLLQRVRLVDQEPWIIVGSSKTFYFKKFLERLSYAKPVNCLGYIDLDQGMGFALDSAPEIKEYDRNSAVKPRISATYCYLNGVDFEIMRRAVKDRLGEVPLISLGSYLSHDLGDIEQIMKAA